MGKILKLKSITKRQWILAGVSAAVFAGCFFALYLTLGRELMSVISDQQTFKAWLDSFSVPANAVFVFIRAFQTVVHNDAMMAYYLPWIHDIIDRYNVTYAHTDIKANYANTGDGQQMGMWIGAQMEPGPLGSISINTSCQT